MSKYLPHVLVSNPLILISPRFPLSLESLDQLCHIVTMCIFTCTGQHASAHLGQVICVIIPHGLLGLEYEGS